MKMCDRCSVPGCALIPGGKACQCARKRVCPEVVKNEGDRIHDMNNEELAILLAKMGADPDRMDRAVQSYTGEAVNKCLEFLERAVEEL